MAYQSSFTGPQIDDVIRLCRQVNASTNKSNLEYLAELGAKIQQIDTNTQQINALYGTGSEDPVIPPPINAALSSKLQLDTVNMIMVQVQIPMRQFMLQELPQALLAQAFIALARIPINLYGIDTSLITKNQRVLLLLDKCMVQCGMITLNTVKAQIKKLEEQYVNVAMEN